MIISRRATHQPPNKDKGDQDSWLSARSVVHHHLPQRSPCLRAPTRQTLMISPAVQRPNKDNGGQDFSLSARSVALHHLLRRHPHPRVRTRTILISRSTSQSSEKSPEIRSWIQFPRMPLVDRGHAMISYRDPFHNWRAIMHTPTRLHQHSKIPRESRTSTVFRTEKGSEIRS